MAKKSHQKETGAQIKKETPEIKQNAFLLWKEPYYYIFALFLLCLIFYSRIIFGAGHFWEDLVEQEFPHRVFARDNFIHFQFPHWNPFTFGGMPFFSALHTGVLYPFNLLLSFLPVSKSLFWYLLELMIVSHIFCAGISMFFFVRHKKLSGSASFFAAVGYMFCGFFITHIIHSLMLYILAWLPLIILLIEKGFEQKRYMYLIPAGGCLGLTIFAGHPQITFYEFLFIGCYSIYLWFTLPKKNISILFYIAGMFILAAGIAAVQLFPSIELSKYSARVSWTFEQACEGSVSFAQLLTFLIPKLFGAWTGPESHAPQFWLKGPMNGYYTYWDTCFYTGIIILILASIQLKNIKKNAFILFAVLWMVFSISIAMGPHFFVYKLFFDYIPGFDKFRSPARILFTWNFLLPVLAATTFDRVRDIMEIRKISKSLFIMLGLCGVLAFLVLSGFLKNVWPDEMGIDKLSRYSMMQGGVLLLNVILIVIPFMLALTQKITTGQMRLLFTGALVIDLFIFGFNHHTVSNSSPVSEYGRTKELTRALQREYESELFRFNSRQFVLTGTSLIGRQSSAMIFKRNQGMIDKIQLLEGYNPLNLNRRIPPLKGNQFAVFLDLMNTKYYINPAYDERSGDLILLNQTRLPRGRMFYQIKLFPNDTLLKDFMMNNQWDYRRVLLLTEQPGFQLPDETSDTIPNSISITRYSNNDITVRVSTEKNGLLWMSELWYPAWKAFVDGKPTKIFCADYSFRAVGIPEGSHEVTFVFASSYFKYGLFITCLFLASIIASLLFFLRKKSGGG